MIYFLDSSALLAYLKTEEGADIVEELINKAREQNKPLFMSTANLTEVLYDQAKDATPAAILDIWDIISILPITFINKIGINISREAARIKMVYHIALGDCFGLATCHNYGGTFVTADNGEMRKIEQDEGFSMLWVRPEPYNA
jgi:PIN domain nuclease of toxin-antitoxin system